MRSTALKFITAICVTLMDALVARRYGALLWDTLSPIARARIGLLLLADAIAFTLMDIWSKTLGQRVLLYEKPPAHVAIPSSGAMTELGGADV